MSYDWQKVRIQETMNEDQKEPGRVPRTIEVELKGTLVDSCVPGDIITVTGIVKMIPIDKRRGKNADLKKGFYYIYIDAYSVANSKQMDGNVDIMQFSKEDIHIFNEISKEPDPFRLIVHSVCPSIYGHEMVKAGLCLTLFGGSQKVNTDTNKLRVRGDPHLLIVGDPGLGKSQMLQAVSNLAPRGVYVCGSYSSSSGLTVTLQKEAGTGDYAIEAGALVLADQGICCIDEFDKMGEEHQSLLEAMEQQTISVAKAGIVCNLMARTSVIAAANPSGGHYNRSKTVAENLKMNPALLSRFDLIFILLDKPDEEMDQLLSEHVMLLHAQREGQAKVPNLNDNLPKNSPEKLQQKFLQSQQSKLSKVNKISASLQSGLQSSLLQRLRMKPKEKADPLPPQILRKYIGYARKCIHPKLSPQAAKVLQQFFLDLREKHKTVDSTPITNRQLESMIRLSEARAKMELREVVTKQDADDVVEIMKESLFETYEDQYGNVDFTRSSGLSKTKKVHGFVAALQKVRSNTGDSVFTMEQLKKVAQDIKLNVVNLDDFVSNLNVQGYLLKKGPKTFELLS